MVSVAGPAIVWADPILLLPGTVLPPGQGELRLYYSAVEDNKIHDGSAGVADLAEGESRRLTGLPFVARYSLPGGEELMIRSGYFDRLHRLSHAKAFSHAGLTDLLVMARNHANPWGDLRGALGIGFHVPIGRGINNVEANEAPSGDGGWSAVASFAWDDKRGSAIFHAEVTYGLRFPRVMTKVMGQSLTDEVKFGFTHWFEWGVGLELKATDALSFFGEFTGQVRLSQSGTYTTTGGDASDEINTKARPEFGVQHQDSLWITPWIQVNVSPALKVAGGVSYPLRLTNGYSGLTYLVYASYGGLKL